MTSPSERRVLVVCHGAINRSPLAAAVLRSELPPEISVNVAALKYNGGGERAAAKMRRAAAALGFDLEAHRSTPITSGLLELSDLVVYMDNGNLARIIRLAEAPVPRRGQKWVCLGQFASPQTKRIPDPAYMSKDSEDFRRVVVMIHDAAMKLAAAIKSGAI